MPADRRERRQPGKQGKVFEALRDRAGERAMKLVEQNRRRAERRVVRLAADIELPVLTVIYLNRLSDLLFMLARVANRRAGAGEVTW